MQSQVTEPVEQLANARNPDFTAQRRDDLQRQVESDSWSRLEFLLASEASADLPTADDVRDCEAGRIVDLREVNVRVIRSVVDSLFAVFVDNPVEMFWQQMVVLVLQRDGEVRERMAQSSCLRPSASSP